MSEWKDFEVQCNEISDTILKSIDRVNIFKNLLILFT